MPRLKGEKKGQRNGSCQVAAGVSRLVSWLSPWPSHLPAFLWLQSALNVSAEGSCRTGIRCVLLLCQSPSVAPTSLGVKANSLQSPLLYLSS